jgi:hypothetical protein
MITDEELDSAVAAGAISPEAATALRTHVAELKRTPAVDEEHFRLVSGFNDVFVVVASSLLLASVAWIGASAAPWIGAVAMCGTAWVLAEFFVRKRRMALPAIVLLIAFVGGAFFASRYFLESSAISLPVAGAFAALAAWLHWMRFHVPITVAAGATAVAAGLIASLISIVPNAESWLLPLLLFIAGLAAFGLAMRWDASDRNRLTRRSDVAFWLHLLAAPLLVHPIFTAIGVFAGETGVVQTLLVVALYFVVALVSLAIDRRALMVSALGYVLYAFTSLLNQTGVVSLSFAITALLIGSALLLLSAFWQKSRAMTVQRLPDSIQAHLAPHRY